LETAFIVSLILTWLVILFNLLLTFGIVRRLNAKSHSGLSVGLKEGEPAPDFIAHTLNREEVTLSTFTGHQVVFVFISPDCRPCREILPSINALGPKALIAGVELVLVSGSDAEKTSTLAAELDISLRFLVAPLENTSFIKDYKSTNTPSYCYIDEQGKIRSSGYCGKGGASWENLSGAWTKKEALASL